MHRASVLLKECDGFLLKQIERSLYNHRYCKLGTIVSNKDRLFSYYSHCIPKPIHIKNKNFGKIKNDFGYGGEDAFFTFKLNVSKLSNIESSPLFFIGVADGVGSWKPQKACCSAKYAQELMLSGIRFLSTASIQDINNNNDCYNLSHKLAYYCSDYVNNKMCFDGASTLCILNIDKLKLNAFNLGDSGFCIYRHKNKELIQENDCYEVIYKSPSQEQGFGIPYQLGSHPTANSIDDGYCLEHFNLKSLDIVIVGSDGLWDNLWDHEVSTIICDTMTTYYNKWNNDKKNDTFNNYVHNKIVNGDLTHKIIKQAYLNSIDTKISTPWSQAMTQTVDMVYNGGKPDDITCVVVFIH